MQQKGRDKAARGEKRGMGSRGGGRICESIVSRRQNRPGLSFKKAPLVAELKEAVGLTSEKARRSLHQIGLQTMSGKVTSGPWHICTC